MDAAMMFIFKMGGLVIVAWILNVLYLIYDTQLYPWLHNEPIELDNEREGVHECGGRILKVRIDTRKPRIKLTWEFKEEMRGRGIYMEWSRKEAGGFLDSVGPFKCFDNGSAVDPIEERRTYCYTFVVRKEVFVFTPLFSGRHIYESFDCIARPSGQKELMDKLKAKDELKKLKEKITPPKAAKVDPRERYKKALKELGMDLKFDASLEEMEKEAVKKVKREKLTAEEKDEKIMRIRGLIGMMRDKHL
jgi:hypothetical protein